MAQPITCDICTGEPAVLLQTDVTTGDVMSVGAACLFPFYLGAAGGLADGMPPEVRAEYASQVGALAEAFTGPTGAVGGPARPAKAPRARKGTPAPASFPAAGTGAPESADGQADGTAAGQQ